ncbi:hypothetical protein U1Q18_010693, partial [Sarracenia purpurea var. burkii]
FQSKEKKGDSASGLSVISPVKEVSSGKEAVDLVVVRHNPSIGEDFGTWFSSGFFWFHLGSNLQEGELEGRRVLKDCSFFLAQAT